MFKNTGRHTALPRESRGHVRRVAKITAAALGIAATLAAGVGSGAVGAVGTPWLPGQVREVVHAAAQLRPAVSMSAPVGPARPVWDGKGTYSNASGTQPLCPPADAGHRAVAGTGKHRFSVVCVANGPVFTWDALTGGAR